MRGTVREALARATAALAAAGVPDPARDARRLIAGALGLAPDRVTLAAAEPLSPAAADELARMVAERARFRPVAQIVGRRLFWGSEFGVTAAVLDPRPETEILVARALAVAAANAERLGVAERARFALADWTEGVAERFDLLASNPPYIAAAEVATLAADVRDWEPRHALTPGPTGLEAYARIVAGLPRVLAPGGRVLLEIGATQGAAVAALLREAGFARVAVHRDLDGRDRVVEAA